MQYRRKTKPPTHKNKRKKENRQHFIIRKLQWDYQNNTDTNGKKISQ